jgi:hypothetical protein
MSDFRIFVDDLAVYLIVFLVYVLGALLTLFGPAWNSPRTRKLISRWAKALALDEQGGYVHDTAMSQYIPPNLAHCVTGTWTDIAGQVAGTIVRHKAAAAETATINIPLIIPSNSVAQKGALLKSVEVDYEILVAACTSWTMSIVKVARGIDTAVAVVSAPAGAQLLLPATTAATVDQHKDVFTLATPAWIDNDEYYLLKIVAVAAATTQIDILGAVANYTLRV